MSVTIDKSVLKESVKESLKELLLEDPNLFKTVLKELQEESNERKKQLDYVISSHFQEYEEVFKALA